MFCFFFLLSPFIPFPRSAGTTTLTSLRCLDFANQHKPNHNHKFSRPLFIHPFICVRVFLANGSVAYGIIHHLLLPHNNWQQQRHSPKQYAIIIRTYLMCKIILAHSSSSFIHLFVVCRDFFCNISFPAPHKVVTFFPNQFVCKLENKY